MRRINDADSKISPGRLSDANINTQTKGFEKGINGALRKYGNMLDRKDPGITEQLRIQVGMTCIANLLSGKYRGDGPFCYGYTIAKRQIYHRLKKLQEVNDHYIGDDFDIESIACDTFTDVDNEVLLEFEGLLPDSEHRNIFQLLKNNDQYYKERIDKARNSQNWLYSVNISLLELDTNIARKKIESILITISHIAKQNNLLIEYLETEIGG